VERGKHFGNVGGVVLTVAVQCHHDSRARSPNPGPKGPALSGIATVPDNTQHGNFRFQFNEPGQRVVCGPVIDEHKLDVLVSDRTNNLARERRYILRFILQGHDHRERNGHALVFRLAGE
jgi:hypothetical protein